MNAIDDSFTDGFQWRRFASHGDIGQELAQAVAEDEKRGDDFLSTARSSTTNGDSAKSDEYQSIAGNLCRQLDVLLNSI